MNVFRYVSPKNVIKKETRDLIMTCLHTMNVKRIQRETKIS